MITLDEIVRAFDVEKIEEVSTEDIQITDLKEVLKTEGHVFVVRGDLAYADRLEDKKRANPKFWLYGNLLASQRMQSDLQDNPKKRLFDGVGFSALEALAFYGKQIRRDVTVVMAYESEPRKEFLKENPHVEVIHADGPMEEGYVKKQAEVLAGRGDLIPLHQALYGAEAIAPVGNKIIKELEGRGIELDASFWVIASGANLYGIGGKIKCKSPLTKIVVVEPTTERTLVLPLDFTDKQKVKDFALRSLKDYSVGPWKGEYSGIFPLHVARPNRYLLLLWAKTGIVGFDDALHVNRDDVIGVQQRLRAISSDYDWTLTTALALKPAIDCASQGKNVLVMAYGKNRKENLRRLIIR